MKKLLFIFGMLLIGLTSVHAKSKPVIISPCVFWEGTVDSNGMPSRQGQLVISNNKKPNRSMINDIITGDFNGSTITNAHLRWSSGWTFDGTVNWKLECLDSETGQLTYELQEGIIKKQGFYETEEKEFTIKAQDSIFIKRGFSTKGDFFISPFSIKGIVKKADTQTTYLTEVKDYTQEMTTKVSHSERCKWVTEEIFSNTRRYSDGAILTENENTINAKTAKGSYVVIDSHNEQLIEFTWYYPEAIVHYVADGHKGNILYTDGSSYEGTFDIGLTENYYNAKKIIKSLMVDHLNQVDLAYHKGTEHKRNGKTVNWSENLTDDQRTNIENKAGKVIEVLAKMQMEEVAKHNSALLAAKPNLVSKYGEKYVNDIFNGKVEKGMPIELFRDLRQLDNPLIEVSIEIYSPGVIKRRTLLCAIHDRKTGEVKFQQYLHFNRFDDLTYVTSSPISPFD